jgi:hypothetical protein
MEHHSWNFVPIICFFLPYEPIKFAFFYWRLFSVCIVLHTTPGSTACVRCQSSGVQLLLRAVRKSTHTQTHTHTHTQTQSSD